MHSLDTNRLGREAAIEAITDFIYTFDLEGRFTYANGSLHRLLLKSPGEMVGLNFHDLNYPEPLAGTLQAQIQEVISTRGEVKAETEFISAHGTGYYEYIFVPIFGENGEVEAVAGTTRDITARKLGEIALRESQAELAAERAKLQNLFEQTPAFICTLEGPEFIYGFANEAYFRLIGRRDILGRRLSEILPEVVGQGYIDLLRGVFTTGQSFAGRGMSVIFGTEDRGQIERYVDFIYQAVRDGTGTISSVLVHGVDVTDQVLARQEVERLNQELEARVEERTRQLQVANHDMEGFTYSVSHDLRAPLRAIVSSSRILLEDFGPKLDETAQYELKRQVASANKLANLIDELLKLSRVSRQELKKSPLDLTSVAQSIVDDITEREKTSNCVFEIESGMTAVGDSTLVTLLLLNLFENACKFSPEGGTVSMSAMEGQVSPTFQVKDQGIGFDMQFAHKLFLPFERLVKDADFPGTGIGLTNAKRIAEMHGGRIWAEGLEGSGSTFYFTLGP